MDTIQFPDLDAAKGPKYRALADTLRRSVAEGAFRAGEKLPPVRELAWQLGITPGTVARAYTILTEEGVLTAGVGRGTYVAETGPAPAALSKTEGSPEAWPETVDLRSPRLPEAGQTALISDALAAAAGAVSSDDYARYPGEQTELPARRAVFDWLQGTDIGPFREDDIVLTHGGQNAVSLIFQTVLSGPRPVVLAEELSYAGFRHAARLARARIVSVESDGDGLRPDSLQEAIKRHGAQILCTSPEIHNPTVGRTPLSRRRELAEILRRHRLQVIEDDCYRMGREKLPGYRALLPDLAWYVSSVSKELTPALRLGYAVAPRGRADALRRARQHSSFGLALPVNRMAAYMLSDRRARQVTAATAAAVDGFVKIAVNALGGYELSWREDVPLIWIRLPRGWRAAAFCRAAEREGVLVRSADDFALIDGKAPHAIRIAVNGRIAPGRFEQAMLTLRTLLGNPPDEIGV